MASFTNTTTTTKTIKSTTTEGSSATEIAGEATEGTTITTITTNHDSSIAVGRLVEVASRTWPGINRPGGVARVTRVYDDNNAVDVLYMVGRSREKCVPMEYVTLAPQYESAESQGLRDRSLLLGRCRRCGSLRTDCGSCDWVMEENEQRQRQRQRQEETNKVQLNNQKPSDFQESSSENSDDDIALQDLLRKSRRSFKNHLKKREKWNELRGCLAENDDGDIQEETLTHQQQTGNDLAGDEDDEDVEELWEQSQRRYRRHVRQRSKWQRRIGQTHNPTKDSTTTGTTRRDSLHQSILETLGTRTKPSQRETKITGSQGDDIENDESNHRRSQRINKNVKEFSIGITASSSPEQPQESHVVVQNDDSDSDTGSLDHRRGHSTFLISDMPPNDDPDATFIQPEGRDAAENLPQDMVDRTKDIPYTKLPNFFDVTATDIEDNLLPDICLRLAELQRQQRRLTSPRRLEAPSVSASALLEECHKLWNQVTIQLIRNGTDQCRAALRRLSDDKLFREYRKSLTLQQRKQIRSSTIMDARHLRLDALEDSVEGLVRQLKNVALALESHTSEDQDLEEDAVSVATFTNDSDDEGIAEEGDLYDTQDLLPMYHSYESGGGVDPSERHLGEFDPHQHAYKRRLNKRKHFDTNSTSIIASTRRDGSITLKRTKTSNDTNHIADFVVNEMATRKKAVSKSRQISTVCQSSHAGQARQSRSKQLPKEIHQNNDESEIQRPNLLPVNQEIADDEECDDELIAGLFDTEAEQTTTISTETIAMARHQQKRGPVRDRKKSKSFPDAFSSSHIQSSTQRDRVPISRRMQAFLDKNKELHWHDDDEDERNSVSFSLNIREGPGQRRTRPSSQPHEDPSSRSERITKRRLSSETATCASAHQASASTRVSHNVISMDYLLATFETKTRTPVPTQISQGPRTLSLHISQNYSKDPVEACGLLRQAQSVPDDDKEEIAELHRTTSTLLKVHGTHTLVELIARRSPLLESHVQLLTTLIRCGVEVHASRDHFLELVLLQIVDAVYGLIHVDGWALKVQDRIKILQLLEPIRDALAEKIPIIEAVCRCIVEQLCCQEWRVSSSEDFVFISSIDPTVWKKFVETGEYSIHCAESRYERLGKVWPRLEVEVAWKVILFFGASNPFIDQRNQARWQLITKLFSCSVLAKCPEDDSKLPPNPQHLLAFENDMGIFDRLLRKGALDDLPAADKLVINLIKRAINLQAEDYLLNEESRFRSFPSFGDEKSARKVVSRLWKKTHGLIIQDMSTIENSCESVYEVQFRSAAKKDLLPQIKDLLLPRSPLFGRCLSLLCAWAQRVPKKKVRHMRFLKQLKGLSESLIGLEGELKKQGLEDSRADAFIDAFTAIRPLEIGEASDRSSAFVAEAAANLKILEFIFGHDESSNHTAMHQGSSLWIVAKELWHSMAPHALVKHRDSLVDMAEAANVQSLDPIKVFSAGRIMAIVAFLSLGLSPWYLTVVSPRRRLLLDCQEDKGRIDFYSFPLSCIFACIDCLGRQGGTSALLCHLLAIVTVLCDHLAITLKIEGVNPAFNRTAAEFSSTHIPIVIDCFRRHIDANSDSSDYSLIRLVFCVIRAMSTFQGLTLKSQELSFSRGINGETENSAPGTAIAPSDDFFNDLDDDIFASLEISESPRRAQLSCDSGTDPGQYWKCFLEILVILKPSERFKISSLYERNEIFKVDPQSKYFLTKEIEKICDCLIAIFVGEKRHCSSMSLRHDLTRLLQCSQCDDEDAAYSMKISGRIATQMCLLSCDYDNSCDFVAENMEIFLYEAIRILFDTDRLEVYPSCHFELFRSIGGDDAAKGALVALDLFLGEESSKPFDMSNEDFESILDAQGKRRVRVELAWKFIENLGSSASRRSHQLAPILENFDCDLSSRFDHSLAAPSLEKESFACFNFLRNVISALAKRDVQVFERISARILCYMASQVLRILQGLRYLDRTTLAETNEGSVADGRIKIDCLFCSFSELFIATSAWILRETPTGVSEVWATLQCQLCERIFYPLLRRQQVDMVLNLKFLIQACRTMSDSVSLSTVPVLGITGSMKYFGQYYDMALRRSRQLVFAPIQSSVLQSYLIEGLSVTERACEVSFAKLIGSSFSVEMDHPVISSKGPLQCEIDRYLQFVESSKWGEECEGQMAQKRFDTLRDVIIPKISHRQGNLDIKRKILRVANHILFKGDVLQNLDSGFDIVELIVSFARSLRHIFFQCMKARVVDCDLVSISFSCASNLARLNIRGLSSDEGTLLGQSDDLVSKLDCCDLSILCESELQALYLHSFFQWMYTICSYLVREMDAGNTTSSIHLFRELCAKENLDPLDETLLSSMILLREEGGSSMRLENWTKALVWIEDKLFRSRSGNVHPVVNIYSKSAVNSTETDIETSESTLEPWTRTSRVTRSAKEYMTAILTMSS